MVSPSEHHKESIMINICSRQILAAFAFIVLLSPTTLLAETDSGLSGAWRAAILSKSGTEDHNLIVSFSGSSRNPTGETQYLDFGCKGELTLQSKKGDIYTFKETIKHGTDKCVDGSIIQIDNSASSAPTFKWHYPNGKPGLVANLIKGDSNEATTEEIVTASSDLDAVPVSEDEIDEAKDTSIAMSSIEDVAAHPEDSGKPAAASSSLDGKSTDTGHAKEETALSSDHFSDCDKLAAHPEDQNNDSGYGLLRDDDIKPEPALDACIPAIEAEPENGRYNFNLGRILYASLLYDEAVEYFKQAKSLMPYPAADYYLFMIQVQQEEVSIEEALPQFQKLASQFAPAKNFIAAYEDELTAARAEEEAKRKAERAAALVPDIERPFTFMDSTLADNSFKYPHIYNRLLHKGMLYDTDHSIIAVTAEKIMAELQGWCPEQISKANIRKISDYIDSSSNSQGYKAYSRAHSVDWSKNPLMQLMGGGAGHQINEAMASAHMNDKIRSSDQFGFDVSSDISKLIKRYDCTEPEIEAMIGNVMAFIETAPPYNSVSQPYWDACLNSDVRSAANKSAFCGCFLDAMRGGGIGTMTSDFGTVLSSLVTGGASFSKDRYLSYKIGRDLLSDFTGTANAMMQKHSSLKQCTQPKDNSFKDFMDGKTDSYGRPIRRGY